MSRVEAGELSPRHAAPDPFTPAAVRDALVILLPAALLSLGMHLWAVMSPAARVNSDEALTGLQAYNVLHGSLRPRGAGKRLRRRSRVVPHRTPAARHERHRRPQDRADRALVRRGAGARLGLRPAPRPPRRAGRRSGELGQLRSGRGALVDQLHGLCKWRDRAGGGHRLCGATHDAAGSGLAFGAGLGVGVALWGHPIFGVVAALGCLPVLGVIWRRPLSILTAAAGGFLGALPWLLLPLRARRTPRRPVATAPRRTWSGCRSSSRSCCPAASGSGRPTARGSSRSPSRAWSPPSSSSAPLVGLVVLTFRVGRAALPFTVAGLGAVPALAAFQALSFSADGRYAVRLHTDPPRRACSAGPGSVGAGNARRMALAAAVPVVWGLLGLRAIAVRVRRLDLGGPQRDAEQAVVDAPAARHHRGSWRVLDRLRPRLLRQGTARLVAGRRAPAARRRRSGPGQPAEPSHVAQVYDARRGREAAPPPSRCPRSDYTLLPAGRWEIWVPAG